MIDNVLAFTAEAERPYGLLLDHDLLPAGMDLPVAVQALIAETAQVRAELGEAAPRAGRGRRPRWFGSSSPMTRRPTRSGIGTCANAGATSA